MNQRIKKIRKYLKLNQTDFGKLCGKTQAAITKYETGRVMPDDAFIKLICMKFNVNEKWLRTGEGEMFSNNEDTIFKAFAEKYHLSEAEQELAKYCLSLTSEQRAEILNYVRQISKILLNNSNLNIPLPSIKPDHKLTTEEKRKIVNGELDLETKAKIS